MRKRANAMRPSMCVCASHSLSKRSDIGREASLSLLTIVGIEIAVVETDRRNITHALFLEHSLHTSHLRCFAHVIP